MRNFLIVVLISFLYSCGEDQASLYVVIPYEVQEVQTDIFQSWSFLYFRDRIRNTREHPPADLIRFGGERLVGRIGVGFTRNNSPFQEDAGMLAFYGNGPANGFSGSYQVDEKNGKIWSIRILTTFRGSTMALMNFESRYFSAIQSMRSFSIHKNLLTIHFGDGSEEMVFALIERPEHQAVVEGDNFSE
jgi:heat shock protein HslJ